MKKLPLILLMLFLFSQMNLDEVKAENHDDVRNGKQVMDHFVLAILSDELSSAVNDYYKQDTVIQFDWSGKDYQVVEMKQWEKGNELSHPFLIKLTVLAYDSSKSDQLGTDTLTFGVSPHALNTQKNNKSLASTEVELLEYKHREPARK